MISADESSGGLIAGSSGGNGNGHSNGKKQRPRLRILDIPICTREEAIRICDLLLDNRDIRSSCKKLGLRPVAFFNRIDHDPTAKQAYESATRHADQVNEADCEAIMRRHALRDPRAMSWYMERKWPARWSSKLQIEASVTQASIPQELLQSWITIAEQDRLIVDRFNQRKAEVN